jgi:5-methylcytosine-specific restriction enzyme A
MTFEIGRDYNRSIDIHGAYGGQRQGGISTPTSTSYVFLFTGEEGEQYGYSDGWSDGVFHYFGEGQHGNMEFVRGNRAIRDHAVDGKDLLMFRSLGKGKPVRFLGQFECASWDHRQAPDIEGNERQAIVFHLVSQELDPIGGDDAAIAVAQEQSLADLRAKALLAASNTPKADAKQSLQTHRRRSRDVKSYVLARAGEACECCRKPAPFLRRDGTPYLEPHHIHRLSDSGPDHPRFVAAICPNCHRKIHYGAEGVAVNEKLSAHILMLEGDDE